MLELNQKSSKILKLIINQLKIKEKNQLNL